MKFSEYLILLIFFIVFVGSLSLGIWQIDRGYDKKALENTFSQRQSLPVETNPGADSYTHLRAHETAT